MFQDTSYLLYKDGLPNTQNEVEVDSSLSHSEYAIDSGQGVGLCHPMDYVVNTNRTVNVVVTIQSLGEWVIKFIQEFEEVRNIPRVIYRVS